MYITYRRSSRQPDSLLALDRGRRRKIGLRFRYWKSAKDEAIAASMVAGDVQVFPEAFNAVVIRAVGWNFFTQTFTPSL
jgi:hypothetical protein